MDRLKYLLVITFLLSYQQIIFAQKNSSLSELNEIDKNINESIFIATNTNSFLTGEKLFYKIFCIDKTTNRASKFSKIAYFELIDSTNKSVFIQKLFLMNGCGNGDFFIPTTLESGIYKIIGYTKWMLNKDPDVYFNTDIYIVNPYKEKLSNTTYPLIDSKKIIASEVFTNPNISLDIQKKEFQIRNQIELKIKATSEDFLKGNYMISVRKKDGFLSQEKMPFKVSSTMDTTNKIKNSNFIIPELRGEIITGRISSDKQDIKNKKIALSIIGKSSDFKLVKTDDQGKFIFNLEKYNPNSNIVIQILEDNKKAYTVEIDTVNKIDASKLSFSNLQFNLESTQNIKERLVSSQIENAYYTLKKDSLIELNDTLPFFGLKSTEFKLDAYTRFPTMQETITEVVSGVVFRKDGNNYTLRVYDYDENYESILSPLVLVDGLILEELNDFFTYNPKNIYKVNVTNGLYYYGPKLFNGIIYFTTKNGDYETKLNGNFIIKPNLLRPEGKKKYFHPDYSNNGNTRIPDYRHQLLWIPNVDLTQKDTIINFYTSDVTGSFEVILEGFSTNGNPVFIKETFEVKETVSN